MKRQLTSSSSSSSPSSWSSQLQTKQSYSTACVWFSFRPFLPSSLSFFPPFLEGKWEEEAGGGRTLCHPVPELGTTAPLVGDWSWCLSLSLPFPPFHPGPPFLPAHLLSLFALKLFPLENPARGIYREDNVQRSSLPSFDISGFYFFLVNKHCGIRRLQQKVSV